MPPLPDVRRPKTASGMAGEPVSQAGSSRPWPRPLPHPALAALIRRLIYSIAHIPPLRVEYCGLTALTRQIGDIPLEIKRERARTNGEHRVLVILPAIVPVTVAVV